MVSNSNTKNFCYFLLAAAVIAGLVVSYKKYKDNTSVSHDALPDIGQGPAGVVTSFLENNDLKNLREASPVDSFLGDDAQKALTTRKKIRPVRVYMDTRTSEISAYTFFEDGTSTTSGLGFIRPQSYGEGIICLWGETYFVFQTTLGERGQSMWHVKNILTPESESIAMNVDIPFPFKPMVTLDGQLLVIARDDLGQCYMMSFAPEEAMSDTPSGQRIELPAGRPIVRMDPRRSAYGLLTNMENDQTLIVAGMTRLWQGHHVLTEMYCESYRMNIGWTECELPPLDGYFRSFIVWKNQLVILTRHNLLVYSPMKDEWSTKEAPEPSLYEPTFFLNVKDHLCLDVGGNQVFSNRQVWCLKDIDSTWDIMPNWYVVSSRHMKLIGTLPANIVSIMDTEH